MSEAPLQTFTPTQRRITLAALMIVFLLSALDQTIVSTAMPRIVAQLSGLNLYAWVTTAYLLSSTVMVPIWGKLSDIYGRKPVLVAGISVFILGSALCGLAGEFGALPVLGAGMVQLVVFRAVQGLGGAALFTSAFAVIADLFAPRERAKLGGLFGAVFGLASVIGPLAGGFLTDLGTTRVFGAPVAGWRWVFYINLPLAGLALFLILAKMPKLEHRTGGRLDLAGAALLLVAAVPLLLALSWGGTIGWGDRRVIGLFALALAGLLAFLWTEARVENPIVPLALFRNRTFAATNLAGFLIFMAFMGLVAFLPLYMQLGQGVPATVSGLSMLPMTLGLIGAATASGLLVNRIGRYKGVMLAGAALAAVAAFLLTELKPTTSLWGVCWRVALLGVGLGPAQSLFNLAVQNSIARKDIGVATSAGQFFRQIGQTVGVAVFGAVLTHNLVAHPPRPRPGVAAHALSLAELQRMSVQGAAAGRRSGRAPIDPQVRDTVTDAVRGVVFSGALVCLLAFGATLLVPDLVLASNRDAPPPAEP